MFVSAPLLQAQAPPGEALQVLQRTAQALGVNPGQLRSVRASGEQRLWGEASQSRPFRLAAESGGRVRWELGPEGAAEVTVLDGFTGFAQSADGERRGLSLSGSSGAGLEAALPLALASWMSSPRHRVGAVAAVSAGGAPAQRVEVGRTAPGLGEQVRLAVERASLSGLVVDSSSDLPLELESALHPSDHRIDYPVRYLYSDWQEVSGGVLWPFTVQIVSGSGRLLAELRYQQVQINALLDEEDFR